MQLSDVQSLISEYRYKIELHSHTRPASSCSDLTPEQYISLLAEEHYDAAVLTNHFYRSGYYMKEADPVGAYLEDFDRAREAGEKAGIRVLLGAEYRFHENSNDYLIFGLDEAFLRETVSHLDMTYRQFYETYHREDLLIIQAHPFRDGILVEDPAHMDGMETFNMHPHHNSRVAVASRFAEDHGIPMTTCGTDLHHVGHEGMCAVRAKVCPQTERELVTLLRSRDYLFEIGGHPLFPYLRF